MASAAPATSTTPPSAPPSPPLPPVASAWRYDATIDRDLAALTVTLCFDGPSSAHLIPGETFAYRFLQGAVLLEEGAADVPLAVTKRGIALPAGAADVCVRYVVDVQGAADANDRDVARRVGGDVVLTHDAWLWRPSRYSEDADIRARLSAPAPLAISSPWPRDPDDDAAFRVPRSTLRRRGHTAFGRFQVQDIAVPGGTLHLAVLDGGLSHGHAPVVSWLARAGHAVAQIYGRFPREHTQVLVSPTPWGSGAQFGWVVRGGGPSVNLLVGRGSDAASLDLDDEWVAVHEMSHLAIPFVRLGEPWLSEGLATWYQNVVRARVGAISEREAWAKLLDGFERGRSSLGGRTLGEDAQNMYANGAFQRVYWTGAALAFLADVEIRRASDGARSLDTALAELAECCLDTDVTVTAAELCMRIDQAVGAPILTDLARAAREDRGFPDVDGVLRALGVIDVRGRLRLDDKAPLAALRRQIMSPREVSP